MSSTEIVRVSQELDSLYEEAAALQEESEQSSSTALVPSTGDAVPVNLKRQMAKARAEIATKVEEIEAKKEELKRLMDNELSRARSMESELKKVVKKLNEGIWTINLYLGSEEKVKLLREGEPAPADTQITIRQMVLSMDQECMIASEDGGMHGQSVGSFDKWLLSKPEHLQQVLPEEKGIVALIPRLTRTRHYDRNSDNKSDWVTYFLIRNGENLYRYTTNFDVGENLVPRSDEFTREFFQDKFDHDTRETTKVPITPEDTFYWEKASDATEEKRRHFIRLAMIFEGLTHRSPVFHPLPPQGVSFLSDASYEDGTIRFILDNEGGLTDGSESFREWQARLNATLRPGMRIIGAFFSEDFRYAGSSDGYNRHDRIHPSNATRPDDNSIHVIESTKGRDGLVIRYKRDGDVVYDGWYGGGHEPKRRASCTLYPSDTFILPFDYIDIDLMKKFLSNRRDREEYLTLVPLIKAAIKAKQAEDEVEAPFMTMLSGVLARDNGVTVAEAQEALPELVTWWKFKNRYHRALVEGDEGAAKAVRMITTEHKRRLKDATVKDNQVVVKFLKTTHPSYLAIVRKRDKRYLVLEPSHPTENVFVNEFEYSPKGEFVEEAEWKIIGQRPSQWRFIETTERWDEWERDATLNQYLTQPEIKALTYRIVEMFDVNLAHENELFLGVTYNPEKRKFTSWALEPDETNPRYREYPWQRQNGQAVLGRETYGHRTTWGYRSGGLEAAPWGTVTPLYEVPGAVEEARKQVERLEAAKSAERKALDALRNRVGSLQDSIKVQWEARAEKDAYEKFLKEYADPGLWEFHRKLIEDQFEFQWPEGLYNLLADLVERDIDPAGMTVREAQALSDKAAKLPADILDFKIFDAEKEPARVRTFTINLTPDENGEIEEDDSDEIDELRGL